jgi:hypothetical protein
MSALLHAPLSILILIRSIEEINGNHHRISSAEQIAELMLEASNDFRFSTLSVERFSELVVECVIDLSPHAPDYQERVDALLARAPFLQRAIGQLLDAPGTADWFADLDRKRQVWVSPDGRPPDPLSFLLDLRPFHREVPKPRRALWTSTSVGSCPSPWISYLRWGEDHRPPPYSPFRLEVSPMAQVYEIHEPRAWHTLCLTYPLDGALLPNWEAVAREWDGIHLSVGGLLTTEMVRYGPPEAWTMLSGWNIESTVWFRWIFDRVERLPDAD